MIMWNYHVCQRSFQWSGFVRNLFYFLGKKVTWSGLPFTHRHATEASALRQCIDKLCHWDNITTHASELICFVMMLHSNVSKSFIVKLCLKKCLLEWQFVWSFMKMFLLSQTWQESATTRTAFYSKLHIVTRHLLCLS